MTLYEFKLLDKDQQYDVTFNRGTFVEYYLEIEKRFALYAVDKFFMEVEYDVQRNKVVNLVKLTVLFIITSGEFVSRSNSEFTWICNKKFY